MGARWSEPHEIFDPAAPSTDQVPQVTTTPENAQEGRGLLMPDQRRITREIMRGHSDACENGAPQPRGTAMHQLHATQIFDCISRTLEGQPGHLRLQGASRVA